MDEFKKCLKTHIKELNQFLGAHGFSIRSEHGVDPDGWVNVYCARCKVTHQIVLRGR